MRFLGSELWIICILLAVILDHFTGDPKSLTHPVVLIGKLIKALTKFLETRGRFAGLVMWAIVILGVFLVCLLIEFITLLNPILFLLLNSWFLSTALAEKSLKDAAVEPVRFIETDLDAARKSVGMIVGRDTGTLSKEGILKAVVETQAENAVDGILAPLFYMFIGCFLSRWVACLNPFTLVYIYKAVNTMDSMVGYTDFPYTKFGYFPARLDDLFNYVPARLGALFLLFSGKLLGRYRKGAYAIFKRFRRSSPSPNSGHPEAAVAGMLGLELCGSQYYFGNYHEKPVVGIAYKTIEEKDVLKTVQIVFLAELLFVLLFTVLLLLV